jgi:dihydrofolate reductase
MSETTLYIATTLDGKIARKDGSLDWLFALANPNQIDHGYAKFIESIGTTVMGKNTLSILFLFGVFVQNVFPIVSFVVNVFW